MGRHAPGSLENSEAEEGVGSDQHGCGTGPFEQGDQEGLAEKVTLDKGMSKGTIEVGVWWH